MELVSVGVVFLQPFVVVPLTRFHSLTGKTTLMVRRQRCLAVPR